MKKITLLVLVMLMCVVPLYSRPKLEVSFSNIHPVYPGWYKRYNLSLAMNPSSCFGLRVRLGSVDFESKDFSFNSSSYGYIYPYSSVDALLYFTRSDISLYSLLRVGASYDGDSGYYEEYSSFSFYSTVGFGVDWYFLERAAFSVEVQDFLWFGCYRSYGETRFHLDGNPGIIFVLKFGIY
jgi:hypothetical protein